MRCGWNAALYALLGVIYFTPLKMWRVTSLSFISVFTPAIALLLSVEVLDERLTRPVVVARR